MDSDEDCIVVPNQEREDIDDHRNLALPDMVDAFDDPDDQGIGGAGNSSDQESMACARE